MLINSYVLFRDIILGMQSGYNVVEIIINYIAGEKYGKTNFGTSRR
ncbi:hypothetical protein Goe21_01170 [Bacillus phage vB_BsuM-Goe21]|nr:hypothetical protein INTERNEXUS_285 [Bacillus phage vB_BspM_Internexus]WCS68227.1 hypothetical protein Goe21_01170 [Bacillus phage vB_BsuM-Goe21]